MLLYNKGRRNFVSVPISSTEVATLIAGEALDVPDEVAKQYLQTYPQELFAKQEKAKSEAVEVVADTVSEAKPEETKSKTSKKK